MLVFVVCKSAQHSGETGVGKQVPIQTGLGCGHFLDKIGILWRSWSVGSSDMVCVYTCAVFPKLKGHGSSIVENL